MLVVQRPFPRVHNNLDARHLPLLAAPLAGAAPSWKRVSSTRGRPPRRRRQSPPRMFCGTAIRMLLRVPGSLVRGAAAGVSMVELEAVTETLARWGLSLAMPALTLLKNRPARFALVMGLAFSIVWIMTIAFVTKLADSYRTHVMRGLGIRKRPRRRCKYCGGFGIVRCDLCNATGFRIYERKFVYRDPCPKCFARRWQFCSRCGGSGDRTHRWGPYALPRVIYMLFPG
ncbi:unnamed protein product [Phaeothamnion confervicola]